MIRQTILDSEIRPPAIAGTFYDAAPERLAATVDRFLADGDPGHPPGKAIIVPHAGHVYSGPIAGTVYATLRPVADHIRRVVLIGPAHRVFVHGLALPSHRQWRTPLGDVDLDRPALDRIARLPDVAVNDEAHASEHCLEVQIPFLQRTLDRFRIVPILAGRADPGLVARVLEALWGGPETLIVISSDLSHYEDYDTARRLDRAASKSIERLEPRTIADPQACGRLPIKGLLRRARALDLRATTLDLRNSGDTAGSKDRVVGYGGYTLEYAHSARLPDRTRDLLLKTARDVLRHAAANNGNRPDIRVGSLPPQLRAHRATFVTLKLDGKLRGCIGTVRPERPLALDVAENAYRSAFRDPRFGPLSVEEADKVDISVSILSHPRPLAFRSEDELIDRVRPDRDGLILTSGDKRGLFLPQVWESLPQCADFIGNLKRKAGLPRDYWSDDLQVQRFSTESFGTDASNGEPAVQAAN